jgi:hypothetical protein
MVGERGWFEGMRKWRAVAWRVAKQCENRVGDKVESFVQMGPHSSGGALKRHRTSRNTESIRVHSSRHFVVGSRGLESMQCHGRR